MTDAAAAPAVAEKPAQPKRKTVYLTRLSIDGESSTGNGRASLSWNVFDGNPRLVVTTGEEATEANGYGKITAALSPLTAGLVFELLEDALKAAPGWKDKLSNRSTYVDNKKFDTPQHVNDVIVGKDNEEKIWISVFQEGRPTVRFYFMPNAWHSLIKADGSIPAPGELSALFTRGYLRIAPATISYVIAHFAVERLGKTGEEEAPAKPPYQPRQGGGTWQGRQGGGGGQGNWQNRGGGQGGGGFNRGGGGGGNWQNRGGGGGQGGNWQNRQGGNQGGGQGGGNNWQQQQNKKAVESIADDDITF